MDDELKDNVKSPSTWRRGFFMALFFVFYGVGEALLFLIVLFQFLHSLIAGSRNDVLLEFSENLCTYLYEVMLYVTYNAEERPFPFAPWPNEEAYAEAPLYEDDDDDPDLFDADIVDDMRGDAAPELEVVRDGMTPSSPVAPTPAAVESPAEPAAVEPAVPTAPAEPSVAETPVEPAAPEPGTLRSTAAEPSAEPTGSTDLTGERNTRDA